MKTLLFILSVSCCASWADNLRFQDGTVYKNITIVSANPDHMLIVHDGGGLQVYFKDLAPDSLTARQRQVVEEKLTEYVARKNRIEAARAEREALELAQRKKGLIEFEGVWMTPLDKEELLLKREERRVELEKQRLLLAKEEMALEREKLQTERARYLMDRESNCGTTLIRYGYSSSYRRKCTYYPSKPSRKTRLMASSGCSDNIIRMGETNPYICTDTASFYNRSPMNR